MPQRRDHFLPARRRRAVLPLHVEIAAVDQAFDEVAHCEWIDAARVATSSGIDSPTIQQRKLSSTIAVRSGETVALGGLIRDSRSGTRSGVPYLARLPGIGALFRSTDRNRRRTELIVLITPRVISDEAQAATVMQELRNEFKALERILRQ